MIAAHPDDEDTELLTVLARGMGAETAYLALTRGEGGQNLIGSELGPALGVLRTEELLAARTLDGARQYFTRAYDFGFSKSLADTWKFWPADSVLKDVVRTIRRFQPQVIVAVFSGTPRDGHGQHQASGWAAREGFKAAADPGRFPELAAEGLAPWTTPKLYQSARFDTDTAVATLDGGALDRAVGQSFLQIAMRGRSLHRSQDMGVAQRMGPSAARIRLVEDRTGAGAELFAGIDTTLAASLGPGAAAGAKEEAIRVGTQLARLTPLSTEGLAAARQEWARLIGPAQSWTAAARDQLARLDAVAGMASGVVCDATAGSEDAVPGSRVPVLVSCWNTRSSPAEVSARVTVLGRETFSAPSRAIAPGRVVQDSAWITIPADASTTQPYYLRSPMRGAFYEWPREDVAIWGEPTEPAPLRAEFTISDGVVIRRDVVLRTVDQALGEVRRPVFIVPRLDVHAAPASGLWPAARTASHEFVVSLRHHGADTARGTVSLSGPKGWRMPAAQPFTLAGPSATATMRFSVLQPPEAAPDSYQIRAIARDASGREYTGGTDRVTYPHVRTRQLVTDATSKTVLADIKLPPQGAIAYVRGAADRIPESLAALGLKVTVIAADSLVSSALPRFRTVVIGPRAWETEPALSEQNDRLLDWVRNGGTLIVQYQQFQYLRGNFAPFELSLAEKPGDPVPARVAAPRVAEEDAAVTILQPTYPILRFPNVITRKDWEGWVQERGLYFPRSWGSEWTPLLEMSDAGEPPLRGALLVTRCGRGTYVYTGLSFFRELPAGVPGAARLFLNLLALGRQGG